MKIKEAPGPLTAVPKRFFLYMLKYLENFI